jgi:limonene-1,2-epoxide hydrolase
MDAAPAAIERTSARLPAAMKTVPRAEAETRTRDSADIAVVEAFFRAMEAMDIESCVALLADDVVYQNVPFPAYRGKRAVTRALEGFGKVMTGFEMQMKNVAAKDGVVLTERVDILKGPLLYLDIWVCGTFEIEGGKITLWRDYFDLVQVTTKLVTGPFRKLLGRAR